MLVEFVFVVSQFPSTHSVLSQFLPSLQLIEVLLSSARISVCPNVLNPMYIVKNSAIVMTV